MSKNTFPSYGFIKDVKHQATIVCDCLGHGKNNTAVDMLLETACAETGMGRILDRTLKAGLGLCQVDNGKPYHPFDDIKKRSAKYRSKIKRDLGIDLDLIEWNDLRYNTFLALLFCRLHYLPVSDDIPLTLKGRAAYWKRHYNTNAGKGDVDHFLKMVYAYRDLE